MVLVFVFLGFVFGSLFSFRSRFVCHHASPILFEASREKIRRKIEWIEEEKNFVVNLMRISS